MWLKTSFWIVGARPKIGNFSHVWGAIEREWEREKRKRARNKERTEREREDQRERRQLLFCAPCKNTGHTRIQHEALLVLVSDFCSVLWFPAPMRTVYSPISASFVFGGPFLCQRSTNTRRIQKKECLRFSSNCNFFVLDSENILELSSNCSDCETNLFELGRQLSSARKSEVRLKWSWWYEAWAANGGVCVVGRGSSTQTTTTTQTWLHRLFWGLWSCSIKLL